VTEERLQDRLARLSREREEADRQYNDALTALDRALPGSPDLPAAPPPADLSRLGDLNQSWNLLPDGPPPIDRSLKGRLRGFVWRLVGPPIQTQQRFNGALIDHLNRNALPQEQPSHVLTSLVAALRAHVDAQARFHALLLQYLQTFTLYIDTRDRAVGGQTHVLDAGMSALADDWLKRWESLSVRERRLFDRVAAIDDLRETAQLAQQSSLLLKREVERLLRERPGGAASPPPSDPVATAMATASVDLDAFKYVGFEDRFRGSVDDIRARLSSYLPIFERGGPVLDVGCGRGELLDLFRDHGIQARGVDVNASMVEVCRERGHTAERAGALEYLQSIPERSLGGLIAIQVVEHLEPAYLVRVLDAAFQALRPGAPIVLETINPACWTAFFESFLRDFTHRWPLHPDTLAYLIRASGFGQVRIDFRSPSPDTDRLQPVLVPSDAPPGVITALETINGTIEKLNARLFGYQDYAAIGWR
jgi:2-polyprenyl-3-methyl-5-hydroxy-6-metoxy-1,4-benzoquinol methylase